MKSFLVTVLFLLSIVAMVAVIKFRSRSVAYVPVRAERRLVHGRTGRAIVRPRSHAGFDLGALQRELRFRRAFRPD